jgi:hypothetical protein
MIMAWKEQDEQRKFNNIEQWSQTALKSLNIPTPAYIEGEQFDHQRKRIMNKVRPFVSEDLQQVKTDDMFGSVLDHCEKQFMESARAEALRPTKIPEGTLKEVVSYDQAGRPSYSYFGSPRSWMDNFAAPKKQLVSIMDNRSFQKV